MIVLLIEAWLFLIQFIAYLIVYRHQVISAFERDTSGPNEKEVT